MLLPFVNMIHESHRFTCFKLVIWYSCGFITHFISRHLNETLLNYAFKLIIAPQDARFQVNTVRYRWHRILWKEKKLSTFVENIPPVRLKPANDLLMTKTKSVFNNWYSHDVRWHHNINRSDKKQSLYTISLKFRVNWDTNTLLRQKQAR